MSVKSGEGYGVTGFPQKAGDALIKASTTAKVPRVPKATTSPKPKIPKIPKPKVPAGLY